MSYPLISIRNIYEYGDKIIAESKTTQNFRSPKILWCLSVLIDYLYKDISLKILFLKRLGHLGMEHRADWIFALIERMVHHMLIECKTYGKEYNKESARIHKDGGQLFTYFQLSGGKADVIMLCFRIERQ